MTRLLNWLCVRLRITGWCSMAGGGGMTEPRQLDPDDARLARLVQFRQELRITVAALQAAKDAMEQERSDAQPPKDTAL